jgi:hypothetical protein
MARLIQKVYQDTQHWFGCVISEYDDDPAGVDALSKEEVYEDLATRGVDMAAFKRRLQQTFLRTGVQQTASRVVKWLSPLWEPQWAGQFVGAADIPKQVHTFYSGINTITITCSWQPQSGEVSACLELVWSIEPPLEGHVRCQFVDPETQNLFTEVDLSNYAEGGMYLTGDSLGFNPVTERWGVQVSVDSPSS